jgi:hypothetical protein
MIFRTRLSLLSLETRENPSLMVAPPITSGAPATTSPVTAAASGGAAAAGANTIGGGQIASTGNVNVTSTAINIATSVIIGGTSTTTNTGIFGSGNNLSGQPLLESSLVNN